MVSRTEGLSDTVVAVPPNDVLRRARQFAHVMKAVCRLVAASPSYILKNTALLAGCFPRECPICGYSGYFRAFGYPPRYDALCPECGSLERHRLMYLHCIGPGSLDPRGSLLHFAPETVLRRLLGRRIGHYITADISGRDVDRKLDIQDIDMPSNGIDAIICNHVLEHVDDERALNELYRILKPGGVLYCMVPIVEGWPKTYENPSVTTDLQRTLHFGQHDHVRFYGSDFRDRITRAGFSLTEHTAFGEEATRYGLLRGEKVFVCRKPA